MIKQSMETTSPGARCIHCRASLPENTTSCPACGKKTQDATCPQCLHIRTPDASFCKQCGYGFQSTPAPKHLTLSSHSTCPACHSAIPEGSLFCARCGLNLEAANTPPVARGKAFSMPPFAGKIISGVLVLIIVGLAAFMIGPWFMAQWKTLSPSIPSSPMSGTNEEAAAVAMTDDFADESTVLTNFSSVPTQTWVVAMTLSGQAISGAYMGTSNDVLFLRTEKSLVGISSAQLNSTSRSRFFRKHPPNTLLTAPANKPLVEKSSSAPAYQTGYRVSPPTPSLPPSVAPQQPEPQPSQMELFDKTILRFGIVLAVIIIGALLIRHIW